MASLQLYSVLTVGFLIVSSTFPSSASGDVSLPRSLLAQDELTYLNRHALGLDSMPFGSIGDASFDVERHEKLERHALLSSKASSTAVSNSSNSSSSNSTMTSSSSSCDQPYGVLPCTDTVIGCIFLLATYGYLLFVAAKLLSEGSELLLTVLDAGLIGGLLLPILGSLPDSILILVSGMGGTTAEAQEQVLVGIGLLAGSIVMLLTLLWGSCLILGRCDIVEVNSKYTTIDKQLSKPFSLQGTGVETDDLTRLSAGIMILSIIPYVVAQLPRLFRFDDSGNIAVLIACIMALGGLVSYCLYQVFTPWIQERRKQMAERRHFKLRALDRIMHLSGSKKGLIDTTGELDKSYARRLFKVVDQNQDNNISYNELRALLAVSFARENNSPSMVDHFMKDFDSDQNQNISEEEFLAGMEKLCKELKLKPSQSLDVHLAHAENDYEEFNKDQGNEDEDDDEAAAPISKGQVIRKAVIFLVLGTIVAAVFADPLVDAVSDFSDASHIPTFFVSFVLLPLASNSSEAVSSILFSSRKRKVNMSLTYSQIYGAVVMNSTMGLGIFLAVVYGRQLVWDFSSEVLIIFLVVVLMGVIGAIRRVFPLWIAGFSLLLYPFSIGLVAILDYVAGWE